MTEALLDRRFLKEKQSRNELKKKEFESFLKESHFLNYSSDRLHSITGITKSDLIDLFDKVKSEKWRFKFNFFDALVLYLARLRLGLSLQKIAALFNLTNYKHDHYRLIDGIRRILSKSFLPNHLGVDHISRGLINIHHTTEISKTLFELNEESIATVWDGTYVYIQKSSNYSFQRKTYYMHKYRSLVKFMVIVTTTGIFFIILRLFLLYEVIII